MRRGSDFRELFFLERLGGDGPKPRFGAFCRIVTPTVFLELLGINRRFVIKRRFILKNSKGAGVAGGFLLRLFKAQSHINSSFCDTELDIRMTCTQTKNQNVYLFCTQVKKETLSGLVKFGV